MHNLVSAFVVCHPDTCSTMCNVDPLTPHFYIHYYTPGIYADGYIVFVFPFVCSFVRSYFRHVCRICVKVLRQSFSSGVYLSNYLSESIHIWTIVTLEGWHSLLDPRPQGPCPGVGLEVKIEDTLKSAFSKFCFGIILC